VELLVFGTYSMVLSRAWATANWALIVQRQASTHTRKDTQRVYKPSICSCKLWGERPRRQEEQAKSNKPKGARVAQVEYHGT